MPRKTTQDPRANPQKYIRLHWPTELEQAHARFCLTCRHYSVSESAPDCSYRLLPLTTSGDDCPYYDQALVALPSQG